MLQLGFCIKFNLDDGATGQSHIFYPLISAKMHPQRYTLPPVANVAITFVNFRWGVGGHAMQVSGMLTSYVGIARGSVGGVGVQAVADPVGTGVMLRILGLTFCELSLSRRAKCKGPVAWRSSSTGWIS